MNQADSNRRWPSYWYNGSEPVQGVAPEAAQQKQEALGDGTLAEAIKLHDMGVEGNKEAVSKAQTLLQQLYQQDPEDPLVAGYYGSATCLLGRDAVDPTLRFQKALEGMKIMDKVVNKVPDNIKVRTLRAYVSYRLPEMYFHRTGTAIEDFNYLVSRYQANTADLSADFFWQVLYDLGCAYKNIGRTQDAEATWRKLAAETSDPKYQELVKQKGISLTASPEMRGEASVSQPIAAGFKKKQLNQEEIEIHARALAGDKAAAVNALDLFRQAYDASPQDPVATVYYADALSMSGRDAPDTQAMFVNAIQAMKMMDNAVSSDTDNIQVRSVRANHSFRLPEAFFHRTATAVSDFEYLIQRYEQDNTVFSKETYWQILYNLGVAYKRLGMQEDTRAIWKKLLSFRPSTKYQALIEQSLKKEVNIPEKKLQRFLARGSKKDLLEEGMRFHDLGLAGDTEAVKVAKEILQKAHELDPDDPMVMAYYASSTALVGRDSNDPAIMFGNAIKGLKMLNKASSRDWHNPRIRLMRAYLANSLPESFFHMETKVIKDLKFVKNAYQQDNSIIPQELYWQILRDLAEAHQRAGENDKAKKVWKQLQKETTDPEYQALAEIRLQGGEDE